MNPTPAIVFFHVGNFPGYLYATLESARFFNPGAEIFLIADKPRADLTKLGVQIRTIDQLQHPKLSTLYDRYVHISAFKFNYDRICLARWFYIEQFRKVEGRSRLIHLDSDAMLFHSGADLFRHFPGQAHIGCSKANGPALAFIQHSLEPFLDFVLMKYTDRAFLDDARKRNDAANSKGQAESVQDMTFLNLFIRRKDGLGVSYSNHLPIGHIDHCIYGNPDGLKSVPNRRHVSRKCIYWEDADGALRPSFRRIADDAKIPALLVHFQNGAKRRIRRFNRVGPGSLVPRALRLRYYNYLLN